MASGETTARYGEGIIIHSGTLSLTSITVISTLTKYHSAPEQRSEHRDSKSDRNLSCDVTQCQHRHLLGAPSSTSRLVTVLWWQSKEKHFQLSIMCKLTCSGLQQTGHHCISGHAHSHLTLSNQPCKHIFGVLEEKLLLQNSATPPLRYLITIVWTAQIIDLEIRVGVTFKNSVELPFNDTLLFGVIWLPLVDLILSTSKQKPQHSLLLYC